MIDVTALVAAQPTDVYTALGFAGAVFVLVELYRVGRFQHRTLLGRLLGYAPLQKNVSVKPDLAAEFVGLKNHISDLHQSQVKTQTQRIDEIGDAIEQIQRDIDWLTTDQIIEAAVAMAKSGVELHEFAAAKGLSAEDAELIQRYARH